MKGFLQFICGAVSGCFAVLLYLHKDMIRAAIKGEKIPKAPESCPFSKVECAEEDAAEEAPAEEAAEDAE